MGVKRSFISHGKKKTWKKEMKKEDCASDQTLKVRRPLLSFCLPFFSVREIYGVCYGLGVGTRIRLEIQSWLHSKCLLIRVNDSFTIYLVECLSQTRCPNGESFKNHSTIRIGVVAWTIAFSILPLPDIFMASESRTCTLYTEPCSACHIL